MTPPLIGIIMGSDSDLPTMTGAIAICKQFNVAYEVAIVSAQHHPDITIKHTKITLRLTTHDAGGVTDWHCHAQQTDRLISVGGNIKLALWDGRPHSKSYRKHEIIRFGSGRPVVAVVPPGVWHGLRNESGDFAGYINVIDVLYAYERPDNFRVPSQSESKELPDIL